MHAPQVTIALRAARQAGNLIRRAAENNDPLSVDRKAANDFVTQVDRAAEARIIDAIRKAYPEHGILAEESGEQPGTGAGADYLWVIDPLDGTTNFAHDIPHFAVSIGYYENGEAVCGVVYNPAREDWFHAVRGEGAFANDTRVTVADYDSLSESLVGVGFYYDRGVMMEATLASIRDLFQQKIHGIRRFGTASLDLCQIGCGQFGAFFEYELSPWDFAAGQLFVKEAGGQVTNCRGSALPLAKSSVLASNGKLHDSVLQIVSKNLPDQDWE